MELQESIVWITGAARRLGRAMALHLAGRGADLALHYHTSEAPARELALEIEAMGRRTLLVKADLARPAEIAAAAAAIEAHFGRLDVLINSASNYLRQPIDGVSEADWDASLGADLKGAFFCAQAAARLMRRNAGRRVQGKIVNIADSAALRPYPNHLPYMTAKAGLLAMTQAMALELAPSIAVNAIAPGVVLPQEGMGAAETERALAGIPLGRFGEPKDVLAALDFLLAGSDYVAGQTIVVDGGRSISQPERK
jgi:NAD(P)-dependent dehydrogenase (short-subunit alcohol dehydrogenase family)